MEKCLLLTRAALISLPSGGEKISIKHTHNGGVKMKEKLYCICLKCVTKSPQFDWQVMHVFTYRNQIFDIKSKIISLTRSLQQWTKKNLMNYEFSCHIHSWFKQTKNLRNNIDWKFLVITSQNTKRFRILKQFILSLRLLKCNSTSFLFILSKLYTQNN